MQKNQTSDKVRILLSLVINAFILAVTVVLTVQGFQHGTGVSLLGKNYDGFQFFCMFTSDSNVLAGIASLVLVIYDLISLIKKENRIPRWAVTLQHMAAVCVMLTFLTTALFLGPSVVAKGSSYFVLFSGGMFYFHFLDPVLTAISFVLLQNQYELKKRFIAIGLIPLLIYSLVYYLNVVVLQQWADFYGFSFGGHYEYVPIVVVVMVSATSLISFLLLFFHNKAAKKGQKQAA